jgi:hypothetical protein
MAAKKRTGYGIKVTETDGFWWLVSRNGNSFAPLLWSDANADVPAEFLSDFERPGRTVEVVQLKITIEEIPCCPLQPPSVPALSPSPQSPPGT